MRLLVLTAAGGLLLAGCERIPGTDAHRIAKGEQGAAALLIDPSSAQFRKTFLKPGPKAEDAKSDGARWIVCGEINGKNRNGAYVGFSRFMADPESEDAYLEPTTLTTRAEADRAGEACQRGAKGPIYSEADRQLRIMQCEEAAEKVGELIEAQRFADIWLQLCEGKTPDDEPVTE